MKGLLLTIIAFLFFVTSSCNQLEPNIDWMIKHNIKQLIFFTDEKAYKQEASYYDAIIELKKEFPNEIKNMVIITAPNAKKYFNVFDIQSCPAILLIYNEEVIVKVDGDATVNQIVNPIAKVLKNK
ncbi:hypothetical protein J2Z40_000519 [Cytobacillus eiseniae]|uniref:Small peptidoglycan-associated lipoprotein n=1 Tax=Cytobacillus eiseniae TaxID=762947 RepID=A0ABS4RC48_9BACI|nr:hypothetical protein [Cytobacillus eiseniae]MBP2239966.1 hypothetical protein [Cytobacillus eiseniae]